MGVVGDESQFTKDEKKNEIDEIPILHSTEINGRAVHIIDGMLSNDQLSTTLKAEARAVKPFDLLDHEDETLTWEDYVDVIEARKLSAEDATALFAGYLTFNGRLDEDNVSAFQEVGVDFDLNGPYKVDDNEPCPLLMFLAEYRRLDEIKLIVDEADAGVDGLMMSFLQGHSALYTQARPDNIDELIEGIDVLHENGQVVTEEMIEWIEEEYPESAERDQLVEHLSEKLD